MNRSRDVSPNCSAKSDSNRLCSGVSTAPPEKEAVSSRQTCRTLASAQRREKGIRKPREPKLSDSASRRTVLAASRGASSEKEAKAAKEMTESEEKA